MAVTHSGGLAGNFELHLTAKTAALEDLFATHVASPCNIERVTLLAFYRSAASVGYKFAISANRKVY
jgi:hypothetical protein